MIATGYMPPWPPGPRSPEFADDRSLNDDDKAVLLAWLAAGAPTDIAPTTPLQSTAAVGPALRDDIVLQMSEPYVPTGAVTDDYRCFLLDPQLPDGGFVTASDVRPGDRRVVHHVIVYQAAPELRAEAEAKAGEDARPGWECYGGPELSTSALGTIADSLGFWVPGNQPWVAPAGTGVPVPPDGLIVLQVHYNYATAFHADQTEIVLQVESADSGLTPLRGLVLAAPVEIPCPAGSENAACDRAVSLAQRDENNQGRAEQMFLLCARDLDDYKDVTAANATSECDWRVPVDGELILVNGHMHTLGKSLRVTLNPDGPDPIILLDLPTWHQALFSLAWLGWRLFLAFVGVRPNGKLRQLGLVRPALHHTP